MAGADPKAFARRWLRENKRKLYTRLRRDGELEQYLDEQVARVWATADSLEARVGKAQAYQWAIRSEICGVEWD